MAMAKPLAQLAAIERYEALARDAHAAAAEMAVDADDSVEHFESLFTSLAAAETAMNCQPRCVAKVLAHRVHRARSARLLWEAKERADGTTRRMNSSWNRRQRHVNLCDV